jgi:hypothetical protein
MAPLVVRRSVVIVGLSVAAAGVLFWAATLRAGRRSAASDPWTDAQPAGTTEPAVVVAELFTSEGCSSCPPADEVLRRLVREPLDNTVVLGLGEHVDYWNHLGWRDPFSSPAFSSRQSEYQGVFRTSSIYTPQLVVDGQFEAVGSDVPAVRRALASAARLPKAAIDVSASPADDGRLTVRLRFGLPKGLALRERADVLIGLTQDALTSNVRRGENRGRTLTHGAVVRTLTTLGSLQPPAATFAKTVAVPLGADWDIHTLKVIALLQERHSRRIVGAGSAPISYNRPS